MKRYAFSIAISIITLLSFVTEMYIGLSLSLVVVLLLLLLDKLGKGVVLREIVAFLYAFSCLFMPVVGYTYYTKANVLSKLWMKYMLIPEAGYFSFALPGIALFCLAITFPFKADLEDKQKKGLNHLLERVKTALTGKKNTALIILSLGSVVSLGIRFLPGGLQYFATLFFFGSFAGLLYLYFLPGFKSKGLIMLLFAAFIIYTALTAGMFTIVAYMGINIVSFMIVGKSRSLVKKAAFFLVAAFLLIVLQNVKMTYRKYIWRSNYGGSKVALFADIFWQNLQKGDDLIEKNAFFPIYVRGNQGFNVTLVMRRIPRLQSFDGGSNLALNFASALVPRFLWPDKPEAGGKFNMSYYAGYDIRGFSTNVGPLGEAYGSFGVVGGVVYMFLLGLFVRWAYTMIFKIAGRIPLLIFWIPVMFYQVISSSETDSLQIFNSLIKSAFFLYLLCRFLPGWFAIKPKARPGSAAARIGVGPEVINNPTVA